ncbi:arf-GAP with coiled-coil, ANK repeat and PH domain-containing protein 3b isoform X1 [Tachysurus ichikawai]
MYAFGSGTMNFWVDLKLVKLCSGMIEAGRAYTNANKLLINGIRDLSQHCKEEMISALPSPDERCKMSPDHGWDQCSIFVYLLSAAVEGPGLRNGGSYSFVLLPSFALTGRLPQSKLVLFYDSLLCSSNRRKSILNFTGN